MVFFLSVKITNRRIYPDHCSLGLNKAIAEN